MKEIPLTKGKVALVDDADFEAVSKFKWCASHNRNDIWYAIRKDGRDSAGRQRTLKMHRFILGEAAAGKIIDHDNHNGLDNQRHNLIATSYGANNANRRGSAVVKFRPRFKKWSLYYNGKLRGRFNTEEEARTARENLRRQCISFLRTKN